MFIGEIPFGADNKTIERARQVARSPNARLWRAHSKTGPISYAWRKVTPEEIEALVRSLKQVNAGRKFTRDEMNKR